MRKHLFYSAENIEFGALVAVLVMIHLDELFDLFNEVFRNAELDQMSSH